MEITIRNESITRVDVDAIVNPANSFGYMGGGVAGYLKKLGGDRIENEAIEHAPFEIGTAVTTTGGELRCDHVIHAATIREPNDASDPRAVQAAMRAALEQAEDLELTSIAVPGLGTGVGGVDTDEATQTMIDAIHDFTTHHIEHIYLVDTDEDVVAGWRRAT